MNRTDDFRYYYWATSAMNFVLIKILFDRRISERKKLSDSRMSLKLDALPKQFREL